MRTIRTKVYFFNELTPDAQKNALELQRYINVEHDWWFMTYEDAENIGLKITSFDLERGKNITGNFVYNAHHTATKIIELHGESCESYKLAVAYLAGYDNINNEEEDNESLEELDSDFHRNILSYYVDYLEKEYDYLQTDASIKATFEANSYEFLADGKLY